MDESRRDLLKKAAVGAGVAWTALLLISAGPAAAAGTPQPTTSAPTTSTTTPQLVTCSNCPPFDEYCFGPSFVPCGTDLCECVPRFDWQGCACIERLGDISGSCDDDSECPAGFACTAEIGNPDVGCAAVGACRSLCTA